jgi:hypothetical protein
MRQSSELQGLEEKVHDFIETLKFKQNKLQRNIFNSPKATFSNFHVFFITLTFKQWLWCIIKKTMERKLIFYSLHGHNLEITVFYDKAILLTKKSEHITLRMTDT